MTAKQPNSLLVTQAEARAFQQQKNHNSSMKKKRARSKIQEASANAKEKLVREQQVTIEKLEEGGWKNVSLTPLTLRERHYTGICFWFFVPTQPSHSEED